jgi:hypothetical protein
VTKTKKAAPKAYKTRFGMNTPFRGRELGSIWTICYNAKPISNSSILNLVHQFIEFDECDEAEKALGE